MPIFEYMCDSCGKEFEELVISRSAQINCPGCLSTRLTKKMSVFAHKSGEKFTSSSSGHECSSCSSKQCGSCH